MPRAAALILSPGARSALLIKNGKHHFLPACTLEPEDASRGALHVAQQLAGHAGVDFRDRIDPVYIEEPTSGLRVYVVPNVPMRDPNPAAAWVPLHEVKAMPALEDEALSLALSQLDGWLDRHPEVRCCSPCGPDLTLAQALRMDSKVDWRGPRPTQHLMTACEAKNHPQPCFITYRSTAAAAASAEPSSGGGGGSRIGCSAKLCTTCILPHLGLQLTPVHTVGLTATEAQDLASLFALLLMEGALDHRTAASCCAITRVGTAPRVVPQQYMPAKGPAAVAAAVATHPATQRAKTTTPAAAGGGGGGRSSKLAPKGQPLQQTSVPDGTSAALTAAAAKIDHVASAGTTSSDAPMPAAGASSGQQQRQQQQQQEGVCASALVTTVPTGASDEGTGAAGGGSNDSMCGLDDAQLKALESRLEAEKCDLERRQHQVEGQLRQLRHLRQQRTGRGQRRAAPKRPRINPAADQNKQPVQFLKELCELKQWQQPSYSSERGYADGYVGMVCTLSLPGAGAGGDLQLRSDRPSRTQKEAKAAVAGLAIEVLRRRGEF